MSHLDGQTTQNSGLAVIGKILVSMRAFIALFLLLGYFAIVNDSFLTQSNLVILTKQVAINAILGIGMTFVILTGGIDLSVGSIVGLAGMVAGALINEGLILEIFGIVIYFNVWIVIAITLIVGMFIGLVNGVIITRFNVAPFIATLGILYVARGLALLSANGATFPNLVGSVELGNTGFPELGAGSLLGLPYSVWIMVVLTILAVFIARKTPFGRQVYAIGGNERAAQLSGVRVKRVTLLTYVISGFCSAMVGLIIASQLVAAHPATGETFELNAIAAVVLGGTSLAGGRGTVFGTIIGAFVIGVLRNGMVLEGLSSFLQIIITGVVIILAVVIDQLQVRLQQRQ
ncbi:MAG: ABC transporter permease [Anaerolineae bacterium]|nr:ABC transporter permease [Anaerolineae bacterium]MCA9889086.1 ABC transporter permease [Anaerolineae bacterium]MCA9894765.1 ABC transporter permease [Anaerolineae bacterium]MCB9461048.1 ABC transporter permease [Anaerolineaceae bacterium]